jgi:aquaporin Z
MVAKCLTEFIGTFFLVFTIGLTVTQGVAMAPLAIGCSLMIMVYMGGHVSGGHYNPAVSLAAMMRGALKPAELIPYWIVQVAGAIVATIAVSLIIPGGEGEAAGANFFGPAPGAGYTLASIGPWLIEVLFTFALCLVVLNCATSSGTSNNSFYGLAIGFTVVVGAFAGGEISGGAFNPAVGIGPNLIKGTMGGDPAALSNIPLHVGGPFIGGVLAALVFKVQENFVEAEKSAK